MDAQPHARSLIHNKNISSMCFQQDTVTLELLGLQCGKLSRFALDKRFPKGKFAELYKLWIVKSAFQKYADEVFVYREEGNIIGFVSVKINQEKCGHIDLVVVDGKYRNLGVGSKLFDHIKAWGCSINLCKFTVATQQNNIAARRMYEKSGFLPVMIENNYHFWL